jgi:probable rRNA maturation factor
VNKSSQSELENQSDELRANIDDVLILDYQIADDLVDHLDNEIEKKHIPNEASIAHWLSTAIRHLQAHSAQGSQFSLALNLPVEISVRIVSRSESAMLNQSYRGKDSPTNVLSFESDLPDYIPSHLIGDLVICGPIVVEEANAQSKSTSAHWSHMCIHGCLHLLGFDHIEDDDAKQMETLEVDILYKLGIDDPYQIR